MARKKKKNQNLIFILAVLISTIVYLATTVMRTSSGMESYWSNGVVIAINTISASISFVLIFGYITVGVVEKANKRGFDKWDALVIFLIVFFTVAFIITTVMRAKEGADTYWSNPWIVSINKFSDNLASSLIMGYVLGNILSKLKK